ncbi:MAG TPA: RNA 2',3'-cyclic phosphodiesterase [Thermoguttaceae bacterium]|nr:RNA 2',3'-cyclic phosphodiesterase [Thermoguttaceae bacterium]
MKRTVRTFVAVEISSAVRDCAEELIEQFRAAPVDVKWVETHNLHLTLKFLGDVPSREIAGVCEAVAQGAAQVEPFELEILGAGAFPDTKRPRTLWLGAGRGEQEMVALHDHVEKPLKKLGFRPEHRRFHPHLTIGRVRRGGPGVDQLGRLLDEYAQFEVGRVHVSQVVVFSSQLERAGPTYEALSRAKLGRGKG